jgi:type III pantothenate kinase
LNLVVDIGNTRTKTALYQGDTLVDLSIHDHYESIFLEDLIEKSSNIIVGSVLNDVDALLSKLATLKPCQLFTTQTQIPIQNKYQSISSLGSDRIAASIGAYYLYPNNNVLVIDAGTCIKYNFTNSNNEYLGGGISPGIEMRFRALHQLTAKLPIVTFNKNFDELIGNSTENSILSGVINGTIQEIDGVINSYKLNFPNLICVLTGGDAEYLSNRLKNSIFTHQNLVLKGLNDILNYSIETNTH